MKTISVYEFFNTNQGYFRFPNLTLTTPVKPQENREVKDVNNRGGFHYRAHVAHNKAELYVTVRDTKTRDSDNDNAYSYTNIVIARHDNNGHGFIFHNPVVEAIISRDIYDQLYAVKAVQGDFFPNQFTRVDLTRLNIFPSFVGNYRNLRDQIDTERARLKVLSLLRDGARGFAQKLGHLAKGSRSEYKAEDSDESAEDLRVPVVISEKFYSVERSAPFEAVLDVDYYDQYRIERGARIVVSKEKYAAFDCANECFKGVITILSEEGDNYICKLKSGIYKPGCFQELADEVKSVREFLKTLEESSRIYELYLLERGFNVPAGFVQTWEEKKRVERLHPWQAAQLRRQGVVVKEQEVEAV